MFAKAQQMDKKLQFHRGAIIRFKFFVRSP